jgi:biotin carboxyl carrier protein
MSALQTPLNEAAAFFDFFLQSDWASCHVRNGAIEMFVARTAGHPNPMLDAGGEDTAVSEETMLIAPHLGTLVELVAVGSRVTAGERYGVIELLGEPIDLVADHDGTVVRHISRPGSLVQYEEVLATLH